MSFLLIALAIILISGVFALAVCKKPSLSTFLGAGGSVIGCIVGIIPALKALYCGSNELFRLVWEIPYGAFSLKLDALSAFFLIPIFMLSALSAIYGKEYLAAYQQKKWLGIPWFFFNLLVASMVLVCLADNTILFLVSWEIMALSSFFLVSFEYEKSEVRWASWTYMIATYLGTAFLLPMFLIFGKAAGNLNFESFTGGLTPVAASVCFILALVGFGAKAGIMPFHVWLPVAHPAAPSPVSALMSGVMIKTGIYAFVRILTFLGMPPAWWGWLLLIIGIISGVLGVLFALAQHDLKRLLAYHSVENIGIIVMGLGIGVIGWSSGLPAVAALGFAGGLLHVINHALFKGLLFLGAGSVFHGAHNLEIDRLGGLIKRMPFTGLFFLIGAAAISGLPPLNGFVSEFLIYIASFKGTISASPYASLLLMCAIAGLALIGGLAAACFTKAFGIVFLGEPRSKDADGAHESSVWMTIPMMLLAVSCIAIGLMGPFVVPMLSPVVGILIGAAQAQEIQTVSMYLMYVTIGALFFIVCLAAIVGFRSYLLSKHKIGSTVTWDCGYAAPTARMQYTASSYAQPIIDLFKIFLRTKKHVDLPDEFFPASARLRTHTSDIGRESIYKPAFNAIWTFFSRLRIMQEGLLHVYVLYVVATLMILLIWNMR